LKRSKNRDEIELEQDTPEVKKIAKIGIFSQWNYQEERWLRRRERRFKEKEGWLHCSAPGCKSVVPGLNLASLPSMQQALSVHRSVCHLGWAGTVPCAGLWGAVEVHNIHENPKNIEKKNKKYSAAAIEKKPP
jgi:hypothetical protein